MQAVAWSNQLLEDKVHASCLFQGRAGHLTSHQTPFSLHAGSQRVSSFSPDVSASEHRCNKDRQCGQVLQPQVCWAYLWLPCISCDFMQLSPICRGVGLLLYIQSTGSVNVESGLISRIAQLLPKSDFVSAVPCCQPGKATLKK